MAVNDNSNGNKTWKQSIFKFIMDMMKLWSVTIRFVLFFNRGDYVYVENEKLTLEEAPAEFWRSMLNDRILSFSSININVFNPWFRPEDIFSGELQNCGQWIIFPLHMRNDHLIEYDINLLKHFGDSWGTMSKMLCGSVHLLGAWRSSNESWQPACVTHCLTVTVIPPS